MNDQPLAISGRKHPMHIHLDMIHDISRKRSDSQNLIRSAYLISSRINSRYLFTSHLAVYRTALHKCVRTPLLAPARTNHEPAAPLVCCASARCLSRSRNVPKSSFPIIFCTPCNSLLGFRSYGAMRDLPPKGARHVDASGGVRNVSHRLDRAV